MVAWIAPCVGRGLGHWPLGKRGLSGDKTLQQVVGSQVVLKHTCNVSLGRLWAKACNAESVQEGVG